MQGIQGWSDPPILDNPSLTKTIHGREYDIYVDGDRVKMVAWHRGDNTYWVSNDLLQYLDQRSDDGDRAVRRRDRARRKSRSREEAKR